MRVFITGASGWIGTALTKELVAGGHEVRGLARSDASAEKITTLGGTAVRGEMTDHDVIAAKTGLPAAAVDPERLGVFGALLGGYQPASAEVTRQLVGWEPTGPTLLDDLEAGYYTA